MYVYIHNMSCRMLAHLFYFLSWYVLVVFLSARDVADLGTDDCLSQRVLNFKAEYCCYKLIKIIIDDGLFALLKIVNISLCFPPCS